MSTKDVHGGELYLFYLNNIEVAAIQKTAFSQKADTVKSKHKRSGKTSKVRVTDLSASISIDILVIQSGDDYSALQKCKQIQDIFKSRESVPWKMTNGVPGDMEFAGNLVITKFDYTFDLDADAIASLSAEVDGDWTEEIIPTT